MEDIWRCIVPQTLTSSGTFLFHVAPSWRLFFANLSGCPSSRFEELMKVFFGRLSFHRTLSLLRLLSCAVARYSQHAIFVDGSLFFSLIVYEQKLRRTWLVDSRLFFFFAIVVLAASPKFEGSFFRKAPTALPLTPSFENVVEGSPPPKFLF